jgi:hypothetical protein
MFALRREYIGFIFNLLFFGNLIIKSDSDHLDQFRIPFRRLAFLESCGHDHATVQGKLPPVGGDPAKRAGVT